MCRFAALTDVTITKQSAQGSFNTARADIAHTKVRHTDLKVDWGQQSTYLQRGVTSLSPLRPTERQMAPHRTSDKGPQTLFGATAQFVASSSPIPSQRSTFSMQPSHAHSILPHQSAFSAPTFLGTGREVNDVAEATTQSMTTTTVGTVVSYDRKSVSRGQQSVRKSGRDTPSSTLSSTDNEVAYLTEARVPSYVSSVPLIYPLAPPPCARSRSHRSGRSTLSRTSKASRLTSASQHSLIDVMNLCAMSCARRPKSRSAALSRSGSDSRQSFNVSRPQRSWRRGVSRRSESDFGPWHRRSETEPRPQRGQSENVKRRSARRSDNAWKPQPRRSVGE